MSNNGLHPSKFVDGILGTIREPLLVLDRNLIVLAASRSFYKSFGVSRDVTEGTALRNLGDGQWNIPVLQRLLAHIVDEDTTVESFEVEHDFPRLGHRIFLLNARRVRGDGGDGGDPTDRILLAMEDVSERRRYEDELRRLALTDSLTGLANRNKFLAALDEALKVGRRFGVEMTLMMLDLDHFKCVNDTHGHPVGDGVLRSVAERLVSVSREVDTVARLGGDEFAIILRGTRKGEEAEVFAQRCIASLGRPMVLPEATVRIGACVGIAGFPEDGDDAKELVRRADLALYEAKAVGRDVWRAYVSDKE
jgi:diguanylate cyclase (GGDEF)-like protein